MSIGEMVGEGWVLFYTVAFYVIGWLLLFGWIGGLVGGLFLWGTEVRDEETGELAYNVTPLTAAWSTFKFFFKSMVLLLVVATVHVSIAFVIHGGFQG